MKKILLLSIIASGLLQANTNLDIKGKVSVRQDLDKEGFFYTNINQRQWHDEYATRRRTQALDLSINDFISLGVEKVHNKQVVKGRARRPEKVLHTNLSVITPKVNNTTLRYTVAHQRGDDHYLQTRDNTTDHTFDLTFFDSVNLQHNVTKVGSERIAKTVGISVEHENTNFTASHSKIYNKEDHLVKLRNAQLKIQAEDDGHGHVQVLRKLDKLNYEPRFMEDTFNSKFAFSNRKIDLGLSHSKEIGKFEVEAGVNYSKEQLYTELPNAFKSNIKTQSFGADVSAKRKLSDSITVTGGNAFSYTRSDRRWEKQNGVQPQQTKYLIELLTNETYTGITLINNDIYFNVNHFYESPSKKLTINSGIDLSVGIEAKKQRIESSVYNLRKQALEHERKRASQEKPDPSKLKTLQAKMNEKEKELNVIYNKKDYSSIYTTLDRNTRLDKETLEKSKEFTKDKTYKQVSDHIEKKKKEQINFSNKYGINRKLEFPVLTARDTNAKKKAIAEMAEKVQTNDKDKFIKDYTELYEYKNGVYSNLYSQILNQSSRAQREWKSAKRDYDAEYNRTNVDPFILKNFQVLENKRKFNYILNSTISPYVSMNYKLAKGLSVNGFVSPTFEFKKNLTERTKTKHHIDFISKVELKYEF